MKRNTFLDAYRGFSLVSMLFFHGYYDLVYIFGWIRNVFPGWFIHGWQQTIVLSFIFISGAATMYSEKTFKRGMVLTGWGLVITAITFFFMPAELIVFGVIGFLGAAFLLLAPFQQQLKKLPAGDKFLLGGIVVCLAAFTLTQGLPHGYWGIYGWEILRLPRHFSNIGTFVLGLPTAGIISADYVPIFPHIFVFLGGRFYWQYRGGIEIKIKNNFLPGLGQHSLVLYLLHQPILYGLGCLCIHVYKLFLA
jgi:uncharacterized membrane protein